MSGGKRDHQKKTKVVDASSLSEVDQLLQAAEDQLLLNLRLNNNNNSNFSSSSSSYLDPDLSRRFAALKTPLKPNPKPNTSPTPFISPKHDGESTSILCDDLAMRFATLKGPNLNPSPNLKNDGEEEDEVEKLMQWAKDAARLDPSKSDDDDDDDDDSDDGIDDDDDDGSDDDSEGDKGKGKDKRKPKSKRWFFL